MGGIFFERHGRRDGAQGSGSAEAFDATAQHAAGGMGLDQAFDRDGEIGDRAVANPGDDRLEVAVAEGVPEQDYSPYKCVRKRHHVERGKMSGADASVTISFEMNAVDYARYFAAVRRRQSTRANYIILLIVMFGAIPVALILRLLWMHLSGNTRIGDSAGYVGLFAYLLGAYAMLVAMSVIQRLAKNRVVAATPNAFETKAAVFDATGVALAGQMAEASWRWAAIQDFTCERDLLLLWISSSSAVAIPARGFGDAQAREAAAAFIRSRMDDAGRPSSK